MTPEELIKIKNSDSKVKRSQKILRLQILKAWFDYGYVHPSLEINCGPTGFTILRKEINTIKTDSKRFESIPKITVLIAGEEKSLSIKEFNDEIVKRLTFLQNLPKDLTKILKEWMLNSDYGKLYYSGNNTEYFYMDRHFSKAYLYDGYQPPYDDKVVEFPLYNEEGMIMYKSYDREYGNDETRIIPWEILEKSEEELQKEFDDEVERSKNAFIAELEENKVERTGAHQRKLTTQEFIETHPEISAWLKERNYKITQLEVGKAIE